MKNQKVALFTSLISLLLCMAMLVGTTFAWFTDSVSSKGNKIAAGDLKIELYQAEQDSKGAVKNPSNITWLNITNDSDPLFDYDNWEPGYTAYVVLKVVNKGTLALNWKATLTSDKTLGDIAEVINVYAYPVVNAAVGTNEPFVPATREDATKAAAKVGTLKAFLEGLETSTYGTLKKGEEAYLTLVLQMDEDAENKYQGAKLGGEFDICIVATQAPVESDSFGSDYDENSAYCTHESVTDEFCDECGAFIRDTSATPTPTPTPTPDPDPTPGTGDDNDDDNDDNTVMALSFAGSSVTATGVDASKVTVTGDAEYGTYGGRTNAIALDSDDDITVDITSLYDGLKDGFTVSYWVSNQQPDSSVKPGWSFSIYNPDNCSTDRYQNGIDVQRKYIGLLHNTSDEGNGFWLERGNLADGETEYKSSWSWDIYGYTTNSRSDWTHIVCVFGSNSTAIYVNGELTHSNSTKTNYNTTLADLLQEEKLQLTINKSHWTDGEYLNAYYSDFAIYGKALTQTEVTALYDAQKTTTTPSTGD